MLDEMSREELERELHVTLAELDEVNEMRQAILGQTGVHVGMRLLQQYRARFDGDEKRLEKRAAQIRTRLAALERESAA
jgi:hypothetical protein